MHKNLKLLFLVLLSLQTVHIIPMARVRNFGRPFARIAQNCMRHKKLCGAFVAVTGASAYVATKLFRVCHQQAQRPRVGANRQSWLQRLVMPVVRWFRLVALPEVVVADQAQQAVVHPVVLQVADIQPERQPADDVRPRDVANQGNIAVQIGDLTWEHITSHLHFDDIKNVQRTCRALHYDVGRKDTRAVLLNFPDQVEIFREYQGGEHRLVSSRVRRQQTAALWQKVIQSYNGWWRRTRGNATFFLDLNSNHGLASLPKEIGQMQQIRALNLSFNGLLRPADLVHVCNLENLESLNLAGCGWRGAPLPEEMQRLERLRALNISAEPLEQEKLVNVCNWLPQLQCLDVSLCLLSAIPQQVSQLTELRRLKLCNNRRLDVASLANLRYLPKLEELHFVGCHLATLPVEIGLLPQLRRLNLQDNPGLTAEALAASVCNLPMLEVLVLDNAAMVPEEIGQLHNLRELCLRESTQEERARIQRLLPHVRITSRNWSLIIQGYGTFFDSLQNMCDGSQYINCLRS